MLKHIKCLFNEVRYVQDQRTIPGSAGALEDESRERRERRREHRARLHHLLDTLEDAHGVLGARVLVPALALEVGLEDVLPAADGVGVVPRAENRVLRGAR